MVREDGHKFTIPCIKEAQGTYLRPGVWLEQLIKVRRGRWVRLTENFSNGTYEKPSYADFGMIFIE
jgi:hypothetical protein